MPELKKRRQVLKLFSKMTVIIVVDKQIINGEQKMAIFALNSYLRNTLKEQHEDIDELQLKPASEQFKLFTVFLENHNYNVHKHLETVPILLFMYEGSAIIKLKNKSFELAAGNVLLIKAGVLYEVRQKSDSILTKFHFHNFNFLELFNQLHADNPTETDLQKQIIKRLDKEDFLWMKNTEVMRSVQYIKQMLIEYLNEDLFAQDLARSYLLDMLILSLRTAKFESVIRLEQSKFNPNNLDRYIENHYRDISLDKAAEYFGFNSNYFSNLVKKVTGQSFLEHVDYRRMQEARLLLAQPDVSLEDIIKQVGYSSKSFFYKKFRQYYDTTPAAMRAKIFRQEKINLK